MMAEGGGIEPPALTLPRCSKPVEPPVPGTLQDPDQAWPKSRGTPSYRGTVAMRVWGTEPQPTVASGGLSRQRR